MAFIPQYILILLFLITVDFCLAQLIERGGSARRVYFMLSLASNLGVLFVFKYFNFFNQAVEHVARLLHWNYSLSSLTLILPIGLSFHIFQSLAYIIEVYRRRYPAEKDYLAYALYVMYFPQLVAGPIERPAQLLPQLKSVHRFEYARAMSGLKLVAWGLFKKMAIANQIALLVGFVYAHLDSAGPVAILLAVLGFSIELYADFSGYSDIAIGSSRMLGIELVQNFKQPLFSRSVDEFWRRWHISLSSWFRDYFFQPLMWAKKQWGAPWLYLSLILTFMAVGLWHGAGWSFLLMGFLFGIYIVIGLLTRRIREKVVSASGLAKVPRIHSALQIAITFCLVAVAEIFFRIQNIGQALLVLEKLLVGWGRGAFAFLLCNNFCTVQTIGIGRGALIGLDVSILLLLTVDYIAYANVALPRAWSHRSVRWIAYYGFLVWFLLVGYFVPQTYIYFQF
jgi:D-alanyl-lipoteichoic acid acyltransferase DltB (MBOAT superfamily)